MSDQEEERQQNSLYETLAILINMKENLDDLNEKLTDSKDNVNMIFTPIKDLEIHEQKNDFLILESLLERDSELSLDQLNEVEAAHDFQAIESNLTIENQNDEIQATELKLARHEKVSLQDTLKLILDVATEMDEQIETEAYLCDEQSKVLSKLTSTSELRCKEAKLIAEKNARKSSSESREISQIISSQQAKKETMQKKNSALSEKLAAIEAQYRSKLEERDTLRSKANDMEATYTLAKQKIRKMTTKYQATQQKEMDDIARSKVVISESRAEYEKIKKTYDELNDQINAEMGNGETLKQKIQQAENQSADLNAGCSGLNNRIEVANQSKIALENQIAKLKEPKDKLARKVQSKAENHVFRQPEPPSTDRPYQAALAQERKAVKRPRERSSQRKERHPVRGQATPIGQSAVSSASELQTNSEIPEVVAVVQACQACLSIDDAE